jgi:uncharacterized protein YaiL (DUF2058 family)
MDTSLIILRAGIVMALAVAPATAGQHDAHQAAPAGTTTAAQGAHAQCLQAQPTVTATLEAAVKRLEAARLTNSAAALRAAVGDTQAALLDVRTQLAPCAQMQAAADPHAGHAMPAVEQAPASPPQAPATETP